MGSMNFFEHQHKARRKTGLLVFLFALAVMLIVLAVNLAIYFTFYLSTGATKTQLINGLASWATQPYTIWISLATLAVILLGTLSTFFKLRGGGRVVAELVGASRIDTATQDFNEKRLINIVEEMSIASGTPVPELYVLEDDAINAFVAGYRPTEAVLVVTRGALNNFSRDELQGVIGHEYSHIFNGDMRINIRLMGVLAGILLIGQIGRFLLRSGGRSRGGNKGGGQVAIIGIVLFIIGYIGLFFGSIIKAAISRQREFLADASSVQFTRNPDGIAGALWTIKDYMSGSVLLNAHAEDISHFCFSDAIGSKFTSLMATHPPLEERIKAISPYYDLKKRLHVRQTRDKAVASESAGIAAAAVAAGGMGFAGAAPVAVAATTLNGAGVSASIGQTQARHLDYAVKVHTALPEKLSESLHNPNTVKQVVYALIIDDMQKAERQLGLDVLGKEEPVEQTESLEKQVELIHKAGAGNRLTLINMSIPALKAMPRDQRVRFLDTLERLIKADKRYTIFEFTIMTILRRHLSDAYGRDVKVKYFKYADVMPEINLVLSMLARIGAADEESARATYQAIIRYFSPATPRLADLSECKLSAVSSALQKLNQLSPRLKQSVIEAFADCVIHDGKVTEAEKELLQAVSISLDCPVPLLLA